MRLDGRNTRMASPTVSVIIPCYNMGRYVGQAIDSVLAQTFQPVECIVIDDGSTDETADVISRYGPPVRLIRQANTGRAAAVNRAASQARGDTLCLLDADDYWLPTLLERQLDALEEVGAGFVYCPAIRFTEAGEDGKNIVGAPLPANCVRQLLRANICNVCGAMVCRQTFLDVGGLNARFWPADDYHLWLKLAARYPVAHQPEPLARYRLHSSQASADRLPMVVQGMKAKLHFLQTHPDVRRELGKGYIRQSTRGVLAMKWKQAYGQCRRKDCRILLMRHLRWWPWDTEAWAYFLTTLLPWRWFSELALADEPICPHNPGIPGGN